MGNDVARDAHCEITMSNNVTMCTHHGFTMHNDVSMNLFYYVFSALCLIMILLLVVCNKSLLIKTRTSSCLISLCWRIHSLILCRAISIPTQTQLMCSPQTDQTLTCSSYNIGTSFDILIM